MLVGICGRGSRSWREKSDYSVLSGRGKCGLASVPSGYRVVAEGDEDELDLELLALRVAGGCSYGYCRLTKEYRKLLCHFRYNDWG